MEAWWEELDTIARVYWVIAITGTTFTTLLTVMAIAGLDTDAGDFDMGDASDHPSGLGILSTRAITAFFTGFGWVGAIASGQGLAWHVSGTAGAVAGAVMLFIMVKLMQFMYGLRHSGTINYQHCVGNEAEVYLRIPAANSGHGQVTTTVQGRFRVIDARTKDLELIPRNQRVRVLAVLDASTLLVTADLSEALPAAEPTKTTPVSAG